MAVLKYKNGSTWESIDFKSGDSLDNYPVNSLYLSNRIFIFGGTPGGSSNGIASSVFGLDGDTSRNFASPASFLGGTWTNFQINSTDTQGFSLAATPITSSTNNYYTSVYKSGTRWYTSVPSGNDITYGSYMCVMFSMWKRTA